MWGLQASSNKAVGGLAETISELCAKPQTVQDRRTANSRRQTGSVSLDETAGGSSMADEKNGSNADSSSTQAAAASPSARRAAGQICPAKGRRSNLARERPRSSLARERHQPDLAPETMSARDRPPVGTRLPRSHGSTRRLDDGKGRQIRSVEIRDSTNHRSDVKRDESVGGDASSPRQRRHNGGHCCGDPPAGKLVVENAFAYRRGE